MPKNWPLRDEDRSLRGPCAREIVDAVADAAGRWCDADFPPRVRTTRAIRSRTYYSEPVVDYALDRLFEGLSRDALMATIAGELGSLDALDRFVERPGRPDALACGVGHVAVVASDTTIGVALPPALFALCAKCRVVVRDRSDELVQAFAQTLAEENADLAARLRCMSSSAHDEPAWLAELATADAVVAFGAGDALRALRSHLSADARFIAFGHRTSATYVAREALVEGHALRELARGVALDALLYDGEGCLSSHATFVEGGGQLSVARFATLLETACELVAVEFPPGRLTPPAAMLAYRDAFRFRSALGAGTAAWGPGGTHLLVIEAPPDEPPPLVSRALAVYAVAGPADFASFVRRHALPLEAVAVADLPVRDDVAAAIVEAGAARLARIGRLQTPSFAGEHGGHGRIAPFVRWVTRDE